MRPRLVICWMLGVVLGVGHAYADEPASARSEPPVENPGAANATAQGSGAESGSEAKLARARQHFERALTHYTHGRYRQAITELETAQGLDPAGKDLIYNLALVHEKLGHLTRAQAYYRQYLGLETDESERARVQAILHRLQGAERERRARERDPTPPTTAQPAAHPTNPWVLGLAAVAGTAFVVGGVFGVQALRKYPGPADATGAGRDAHDFRADARTAHRWAIVADVSLLVGVLSGGAASVLTLRPAYGEASR